MGKRKKREKMDLFNSPEVESFKIQYLTDTSFTCYSSQRHNNEGEEKKRWSDKEIKRH